MNVIRTNLQLRKNVAELAAERRGLRDRVRELEAGRAAQLQSETSVQLALSKTKIECDELRKKVRAQSGADLLLNALEAVGIVPAPVPSRNHYAEAVRLSDVHRQAAAAYAPLGGYGLGGRGALGGWS